MALIAVSFGIRVAVAAFVATTVWYVMNDYGQVLQREAFLQLMQNTAQFVEAKSLHALHALEGVSEVTEKLSLPVLDKHYEVGLSCEADSFKINASAAVVGKSFIMREFVNCSGINASGSVFEGDRCLVGRRVNSTFVNLALQASC